MRYHKIRLLCLQIIIGINTWYMFWGQVNFYGDQQRSSVKVISFKAK